MFKSIDTDKAKQEGDRVQKILLQYKTNAHYTGFSLDDYMKALIIEKLDEIAQLLREQKTSKKE